MRKLFLKPLAAVILAASFLGCVTAPMAVPELDQRGKSFSPVSDKAVVYIYRHETFGAALKMDVSVNDKSIGNTVSKSYFRLELNPGEYKIVSQGKQDGVLNLKVETGKIYFVWQEVKMGFASGGSKLQLMSEDRGRNDVLKCKMLEMKNNI